MKVEHRSESQRRRYDHGSRDEAKIEDAVLLALKMEKATIRWLLGS